MTTILSLTRLSIQNKKNLENNFPDCRIVEEKLKFQTSQDISVQIKKLFSIYQPDYIILPQGPAYRSVAAIGYIVATVLEPAPKVIAEYNTKNLVIY